MNRFKLSLLALLLVFAFVTTSAQEDIPTIVIEAEEEHCNVFTTPVIIENFDPNGEFEIASEIVDPVFGGCYETIAEALYVGSGGAISIPSDATFDEAMGAVSEYVDLFLESNTIGNHKIPSSEIDPSHKSRLWQNRPSFPYAVAYDSNVYGGSSMTHWGPYDCVRTNDLAYYYILQRYSDFGWDNRMNSFHGYGHCEDIWLYRDIIVDSQNPNQNNLSFYVYRFSAALRDPRNKLNYDFRNQISASVVGDWTETHW